MMGWDGAFSYVFYSLGAIVSGCAALWIARNGDAGRGDRWAAIIALALGANWCFAAASFGSQNPIVHVTQIASNLAWIFVLFRLFANDGRDETLRLVRPAAIALAFVEILQLALLVISLQFTLTPDLASLTQNTSAAFRVLVSVGALVLLHNLYVGASPSSRRILRWSVAGMAGLWAFTLNFHTITYLTGGVPVGLDALRGLAAAAIAIPFAVGFAKSASGLTFSPSRAVTFRLLSLLVIGAYLLTMIGLASLFDVFQGGVARFGQVGLVIAAGVLALTWLPSERLRGWLRVTAVKHLFKHRYDYRTEWIRFMRTIGRGTVERTSLPERAIKALADITESPSGVLLLANEEGRMEKAAHWHWPNLAVPCDPIHADLARIFEREKFILDLDEARQGGEYHGELALLPDWLAIEQQIWAAVPLIHFDRLVGIAILARPAVARTLDWEDFDLLGIVGQQLASYLSEQAGQEALSEAARFDEFNRRMAFVMHDIKNLSSQMSLLLKNAEKHVDKPEFRKDMLVTLRNSTDKLNLMLARLGRYGTAASEETRAFDLGANARATVERFAQPDRIIIVRQDPARVVGQPEAFGTALAHILQNALDASAADTPVMLEVASDGLSGVVQIVDSGTGMSMEFLRNGLFKPFVSSKEGGFGIGAFEAREMVRAVGGRLDVDSREGLGTRFTITLPLDAAGSLMNPQGSARRKMA